jgi:hypothetical protein
VCHSRNKRINWVISAAERSELDLGNSYAAAVYGADAADRVDLYNGADIIGDINLGDGEHTHAPINTYVLTVDKAKDVGGKTTPGVASRGQAGQAATQVAMTSGGAIGDCGQRSASVRRFCNAHDGSLHPMRSVYYPIWLLIKCSVLF